MYQNKCCSLFLFMFCCQLQNEMETTSAEQWQNVPEGLGEASQRQEILAFLNKNVNLES